MPAIVIGNITLDESFSLRALPRAGETLLADECHSDLGGKGANQAVLLARAGVPTQLVARIGQDQPAARLRTMLAPEHLADTGLIATEAPTDRSIIMVAMDGENCIVSTARCARAMTKRDVDAALSRTDATLLLMQGNLPADVTRMALEAAHQQGMATVFNPAPVHPDFAALWPFVNLALVNRTEARDLTGSDNTAEAAASIRAAGAGHVVVTLGKDGAILVNAEGIHAVPAAAATVCDTTGAGDTCAAVLAAALFVRQMEPVAALHCAVRAAAVTVSRRGTLAAFPSSAELATILAS